MGGLGSEHQRTENCMADAPRIKVDAVKRRMDAGEDFTFIGVRKFETLRLGGKSDGMLQKAIRVPLDKNLSRILKDKQIVLHLTERRV